MVAGCTNTVNETSWTTPNVIIICIGRDERKAKSRPKAVAESGAGAASESNWETGARTTVGFCQLREVPVSICSPSPANSVCLQLLIALRTSTVRSLILCPCVPNHRPKCNSSTSCRFSALLYPFHLYNARFANIPPIEHFVSSLITSY